MNLTSLIESILFVSNSPLSVNRIKNITKKNKEEIIKSLNQLLDKYSISKKSGIVLNVVGDEYQFSSHPDFSPIISSFLNSEISGDLTEPALETITIIAYRGPISKPEIESIRGVNCGLILRNLLIRGLVEKIESSNIIIPRYQVTHEFVRCLGLNSVVDLPEYEKFSKNEVLEDLILSNKEERVE